MIPKVIHYCWFGGKEKPELVKKCIDSWKKYCPDWEIYEWNETNFDISSVVYMKEAYEMKKWAFVSDVARLMIIYLNGGVYLDTDVELTGSIETWLENDAFYAFESNRNIASGLGFGAIKKHDSVKAMLDYYKERHFITNGKLNMLPCPAGNTESLEKVYKDFIRNGCTQKLGNTQVLSYTDYSTNSKHYGAATWVDNPTKRKQPYKDSKLKEYLRNYKRFAFIENTFGKKTTDVYTFFVYDFLEYGLIHYIKLITNKAVKKVKRHG